MKVLTVFGLLLLAGCSGNDNPMGVIPAPITTSTPPEAPVKFPLVPYEDMLDTLYYKVWSDSTWAMYGGTKVIGAATYAVVKDNAGNEYYYSPQGYSGFLSPGSTVILFDTHLGAWPDSLAVNGQFTESTTFAYQGSIWTMYNTYRLADTASVRTTFGTFDTCLDLQFVSTLSVGGSARSASEDLWLARGPGEIVLIAQFGLGAAMVRGHVNGKYWGGSLAREAPASTPSTSGPDDLQHVISAGLGRRILFRQTR